MKPLLALASLLFGIAVLTATQSGPTDPTAPNTNWSDYLGGPTRSHYSPLTQINTQNVSQLQVAWTYTLPDSGQLQVNPLMIDGTLYGVSPTVQAFALDAATGQQRWRVTDALQAWHSTSRGVAYWSPATPTDADPARILYTRGQHLYALDARTGQTIQSFGDSGRVSLHTGLGEAAKNKFVISNTPGTIVGDLIVMPVRLSEGADAAPGHIRAFNVRTGALAWTFRTIPQPGDYGYNTWPKNTWKNTDVGGANCWAGMAADLQRGIVYVPTGSAAFDFWGGNRRGQNLFANCLLALDAKTGKRLWHFQFVHHDLWDRDLPAPPNLLTITQKGADGRPKRIDAVAQITKSGHVFVFDRVTGRPLHPIREVPVPASDMPQEGAWPTQPVPVRPAPFVRQTITEADINPLSPDQDSLKAVLRGLRKRWFEPPSKGGTLVFPGYDGGGEWGGAATDPEGIMYVNANEMSWVLRMIDAPRADELAHLAPGARVYVQSCVACHGPERKGNAKSGYPSLVDIGQRRDRAYVSNLISNGKGMMPGFGHLSGEQRQALVAFLFGEEKQEVGAAASATAGAVQQPLVPFKMTGYTKFLDRNGLPAIAPPWGTLSAIDLNTGKYVWKQAFGTDPGLNGPALTDKTATMTGAENYGGPVVTAGGLLFIAAAKDGMFRAFDKKTGVLLWQTKLPAAGFATPSTYQLNGRQYVVIACGGTKLGTPKGNQYVAFALPK
jgi:quinoprotein glucose dehydrogenase